MELNPTQKDLVLKIAELLCKNDVTDGRAKYWVERAAKLFPGSPAIYKLKVKSRPKQHMEGENSDTIIFSVFKHKSLSIANL